MMSGENLRDDNRNALAGRNVQEFVRGNGKVEYLSDLGRTHRQWRPDVRGASVLRIVWLQLSAQALQL